jgi:hypothetical protein
VTNSFNVLGTPNNHHGEIGESRLAGGAGGNLRSENLCEIVEHSQSRKYSQLHLFFSDNLANI